jgi:acetyl-CoA C-acetyltransferase
VTNVVITSAARTAVGSYGKSLAGVPPTELGTIAAKAAIERSSISADQLEHVVFGHVIHTEPRDAYTARVVGMQAGAPKEVPAFTVNRLCGSGAQAIVSACQTIQTGEARVALAGGCESMSRAPMWLPQARWGSKMGPSPVVDPVQGALSDPFDHEKMGVTAERLADKMSISREEQDEFAVESHRRASVAQAAGKFEDEIVPVDVKVKREVVQFTADEHIRHDADAAGMAKLPAIFRKDGSVTAGNASGMNDAGAALVLMDEARASELGAPVRAKILSYASCGVDPEIMGIGPVPAVRRVLERAGVTLDQVGVIELNEAFAAQALAVIKDLELDPAKVNPNGGAVALGHPIAATGAVITAKCISEMEREDHEYGLVTLCIGGGQGIAILLGKA